MAKNKYEKYIIRKPKVFPLAYHADARDPEVRGFTSNLVYVDSELLEGSPVFIDINWRKEITNPNPITEPHSHPFDQIVLYIGSDPNNPQGLGGEFEFQLDDEKYKFDTTTAIFVPRGVTHTGKHIRVNRPFICLGVSFTGKYPAQ